MAAILRVKRRNSDEPLIALLIASKRRKTDDEPADAEKTDAESTTVLKFAGTVKNQETDVIGHLVSTLSKDELKANYKKHQVDVLAKVREKKRQATIENRYKIINCFRSLENSNYEEFEDKVTTVIDVEDSVSCSIPKKAEAEEKDDYVYDVYYATTENDVYIDELATVHPFHQEFIYDTYRNGQVASENESESENSNSESNWRNDYPDSDHSENSIDEDDMQNAVMNLKMDDDDALSTDDDFVYGYDERDVENYGFKYAQYKYRVKQEVLQGHNLIDYYDKTFHSSDSDDCEVFDDAYTDDDATENSWYVPPCAAIGLSSGENVERTSTQEGSPAKWPKAAKAELENGDSEYSDDADDEDDEVEEAETLAVDVD